MTVSGGGTDAFTRQSPAAPATARDSAVLDDSAVGIAANSAASGTSDRSNNARYKGGGGSVVGDRVNTIGGGGGRGGHSAEMKDNGATAAGMGGSIHGHYGPSALKSAADIEKLDRKLAHRRRAAELVPARWITEAGEMLSEACPNAASRSCLCMLISMVVTFSRLSINRVWFPILIVVS